MVSKRETLLGIFYYLAGLAVTLASPELEAPQRFVVFSLFALIVFIIESGRRVLKRRKEDAISREPQVEVLLDGLIEKYRERSDCHLRANVMVPFENRPIQSQFLKRRSYTTLEFKDHTGGYSEHELELSYESGQGSCGLAWKRCRPVIYGEGQREAAEKAMTDTQLKKAGHVESVLSVPIYENERRPENLVCVVNVDSEDCLSETCFTEDGIMSYTERHADVIAATVEEDYHA
ncbi:hypothetical protein [Natronococcus jeotgali]|uniref:hypothetical protein n=1 Tax=Natronococcus jeotgali TaxID=413812 RepID=UPI001268C2E6|nr:hypothetical protein [Natronococcus jeotgali]